MANSESGAITHLLDAAASGDDTARERLWTEVYDELRRIAKRYLAGDPHRSNLQTTILVHEAYLRLVGNNDRSWQNRRHFFAAAARAMRCICIDQARQRRAGKRGGGVRPCLLQFDMPDGRKVDTDLLLTLDEALDKLEERDSLLAEIVMLRFFAGLTTAETADVLNMSPRMIAVRWQFARAWLHRELSKGDTRPG